MESRISRIRELLMAFHRNDSGQDLIEYALIAALIALGAILGMDIVAAQINRAFNVIGSTLSSAVT